jgi:microcystin-dependent protein
MKKSYVSLPFIFLYTAMFISPPSRAQSVPPLINYQGRLTDSGGLPSPAGTYTIAFQIWDKPSFASGAVLIWGREYPVTVLGGGAFNVIIGAAGTQNIPDAQTTDLTQAFANNERYLGLTIRRDASGPVVNSQEIVPRQAVVSSPYALKAARAEFASDLAQELRDALCPPGTVLSWMGINSVPPSGWEFCAGQVVGRNDPKYARLFSVIGTSNGAGIDDSTFHLPDLRGMFLRGVSGTRNDVFSDPNASSRTNLVSSGNFGNRIGSVQSDELRSHSHSTTLRIEAAGGGGNPNFLREGGSVGSVQYHTTAEGGAETRPQNVGVNFIIKL